MSIGRAGKWLLAVCAVIVGALVLGGSAVLGKIPDLRERATKAVQGREGGRQGAAQISQAEFIRVRTGASTAQLRALVGEPESTSANTVEGLRVECWYYGIVGATGSYQFCFANGKLTTRSRYAS